MAAAPAPDSSASGLRDPLSGLIFPENTIERVLFSAPTAHLYRIPQHFPSSSSVSASAASAVIPSSAAAAPALSSRNTRGLAPARGPAPARGGPPAPVPARALGMSSRPAPNSRIGGVGAPTGTGPGIASGPSMAHGNGSAEPAGIRATLWTTNPKDHLLEGRIQLVEYMIPVPTAALEAAGNDVGGVEADAADDGKTTYITSVYLIIDGSPPGKNEGASTASVVTEYVRNVVREQSGVHRTITEVDSSLVKQAQDSSRFFAIKAQIVPSQQQQQQQSRLQKALFGLGFEDREAAFELSVSLQDVVRRVESSGGVDVGKSAEERARMVVERERQKQQLGSNKALSMKRAESPPNPMGDSSASDSKELALSKISFSSLLPLPPSAPASSASGLARRQRLTSDQRGQVGEEMSSTDTQNLSFFLPPPPPPASSSAAWPDSDNESEKGTGAIKSGFDDDADFGDFQ